MIIDTEKLKQAIKYHYKKAGKAVERNVKNNQRVIEILNVLERGERKELSYVEEVERLSKHKYSSKTQVTQS